VTYRTVLHEEDPCFEPAFALYERTFPEKERTSREAFVRVLRESRLGRIAPSNFHMIVALMGDRVVGMGSGRYLASSNVGYIAYLVVDPAHTGMRIGPGIRNHLIKAFRHDGEMHGEPLKGVIGEVEEQNRWLRILSGRGQVMVLDVDYEQPALGTDLGRVPLMLYLQPSGPVPAELPAEEVIAIVRSLYQEVYYMDRPEERKVFQDFVRRLDGMTRIGHRRLSRKPSKPRLPGR